MTRKNKSRGWGNMTKAERKTEMQRRRAVAEAKKNPCPPPENPNLMQAGQIATVTPNSDRQYIYDLEAKNRRLRHFAVEVISTVSEIAMRSFK